MKKKKVSKKTAKTSSSGELPNWAHDRSKRALKDLQRLSNTNKKRRKKPVKRVAEPNNNSANVALDPSSDNTFVEEFQQEEEEIITEPQSELIEAPFKTKWKTFAVSDSFEISYYILTGNPSKHYDGLDATSLALEASAGSRKLHSLAVDHTFMMTVFTDLFQTIDSVTQVFKVLLSRRPKGKILLIGPPVKSLHSTIPNNALLASAAADLLVHLHRNTREWIPQPKFGITALPHILVGFGNGGNVATHFATVELHSRPELDVMHGSVCMIVLANAFTHLDDDVKAQYKSLRHTLQAKRNHSEQVEHLNSLIFSNEYIKNASKSEITSRFFALRQHLLSPLGISWLSWMVNGVLKHVDLRPLLTNLSLPCLVVQSTQSDLVPSNASEVFASSKNAVVTESPSQCLLQRFKEEKHAVHCAWLKGGHEILEERQSFFIELLEELITSFHESDRSLQFSSDSEDSDHREDPEASTTTSTHVVRAVKKRRHRGIISQFGGGLTDAAAEAMAATEAAVEHEEPPLVICQYVQDLFRDTGANGLKAALAERFIFEHGSDEKLLKLLHFEIVKEEEAEKVRTEEQESKNARHEEMEKKRARRANEREAQLVRQQEREKAEKERLRNEARVRFQQQQRQMEERQRQENEMFLMNEADRYSLQHEKYEEELKKWKRKAVEAKKCVEELENERAEDLKDRDAFQKSIERAEISKKRKEELILLRTRMDVSSMVLSGDEFGYAFDKGDEEFMKGATRLCDDVKTVRQRKKETLIQLRSSEARKGAYVAKAQELQVQMANVVRALELANAEGMYVKADVGSVRKVPVTKEQMEGLENSRNDYQAEINDTESLVNTVTEEVLMANTSIQKINQRQRDIQSTLAKFAEKIAIMVVDASDSAEETRDLTDALETEQVDNELQLSTLEDRFEALETEVARVRPLKTRLVDTDVWVAGSKQRLEKSTLIKNLSTEAAASKERIALLQKRISEIKLEKVSQQKILDERKTIAERLLDTQESLDSLLNYVSTVKVAEELDKEQKDEAERQREAKEREEQEKLAAKGLAEGIRWKSTIKRTKDEKNWVSLDIKINHKLYGHLNERDIEEMKYDEEYQSNLTSDDIHRILSLPAQVQLALPFLNTAEEVRAHSLLRTFTHGDGESLFLKADKEHLSQNANESFLLPDIGALKERHQGKKVFIDQGKSATVLNINDRDLKARESRTHDFHLPSDQPSTSICVSIIFQGTFGRQGYNVGRIAAMLYYLPPIESSSSEKAYGTPIAIGAAKYSDINLCSQKAFGRMVINHHPDAVPLNSLGLYQVVVGSPSKTKYSINASCKLATKDATALQDSRAAALKHLNRLPLCKQEIESLYEGMRLTNRKIKLVRESNTEAQESAAECEKKMAELTAQLDNDDLCLDDMERHQISKQIRLMEKGFANHCKVVASRYEEEQDIKKGLERMAFEHQALMKEKQQIEKELAFLQRFLPQASGIIFGDVTGYKVADELGGKYVSAKKVVNPWAKLAALKSKLPSLMTPAQRLRRKYVRHMGESLSPEERQWVILDIAINKEKYPKEDKSVKKEEKSKSKKKKNISRPNRVLFKLNKMEEKLASFSGAEINRILGASWNSLERKEIQVRKILASHPDVNSVKGKFSSGVAQATAQKNKKFEKIQYNKQGDIVETDIDLKCRLVQLELDRAVANTNETMDSLVLHTNVQRFPTPVLRLELEKELDRLLMSQVKERDRSNVDDEDALQFDSDEDEEALIVKREKQKKANDKKGYSYEDQRKKLRENEQEKSLEHRQRELLRQELGEGGCLACRSNPCKWQTYMDTDAAMKRLGEIQEELERVKHCHEATFRSRVCLTALRNNAPKVMARAEVFEELTREQQSWDRHLKLREVDQELHESFCSDELNFETRALHGFSQRQLTSNVRIALDRAHSKLVAQITCSEVVEDILEGMLEGWAFGKRESERQALGFVPSIKRSGPLTFTDLRKMDRNTEIVEHEKREDAAKTNAKIIELQGTPADKWLPIEFDAAAKREKAKGKEITSNVDHVLTETENVLKFGLFCMTLMYFRGLSMLKQQRDTWSGANDAVSFGAKKAKDMSKERAKMQIETKKQLTRQRTLNEYNERVDIVRNRKQLQQEEETMRLRKRLWDETRQGKLEKKSAVLLQKIYRGHMGRRAALKWKLQRAELEAEAALRHASAISLQRAYRGRLGRLLAEEKRLEISEFIAQIRAQEVLDEEDEYWKTHRYARWKKHIDTFMSRKS